VKIIYQSIAKDKISEGDSFLRIALDSYPKSTEQESGSNTITAHVHDFKDTFHHTAEGESSAISTEIAVSGANAALTTAVEGILGSNVAEGTSDYSNAASSHLASPAHATPEEVVEETVAVNEEPESEAANEERDFLLCHYCKEMLQSPCWYCIDCSDGSSEGDNKVLSSISNLESRVHTRLSNLESAIDGRIGGLKQEFFGRTI